MIILAILIAILIVVAVIGWKKGIFGFVSGLIAVALAVALTWALKPPVKGWIEQGTDWDEALTKSVSESFFENMKSEEELALFVKALPAPSERKDELRTDLSDAHGLEARKAIVASRVSDWILSVLVAAGVFLISLLLVFLIGWPLRKALKLPGLRTINGFLGMVFGCCIVLFAMDTIFLLVPLFSGTGVGAFFAKQFEESKVLGWLYDHNLIMILFDVFKKKI